MFALKMFYKSLIASGFYTHHFKMFLKSILVNVLKTFQHKSFYIHIFRLFIKRSPSNISKQRWQGAIIGGFEGLCKKIAPHGISQINN